jgi:hypothetical protein
VFTVEAVAAGRWFFSVFSTNKTDRHDITEILLKVVLNNITPLPHDMNEILLKLMLNINQSILSLTIWN